MKTLSLLIATILISFAANSQNTSALQSGLPLGVNCPAFDPRHVSGPDKGKTACPMCKYGKDQGVMIWANTDDWNNLIKVATALETEIAKKGFKKIRAFIIYMNPDQRPREEVEKLLRTFVKSADLEKVAVTWIPGPTDEETAGVYQINPDKAVKNTVFVYRGRVVVEKAVNFEATPENIRQLLLSIDGKKAEREGI